MKNFPLHYAELETLYDTVCSRQLNSLALVSGQRSTGLTTLARALAERAAVDDKKVLLVDLNQAAPALHKFDKAPRSEWQFHDHSWREACIETTAGYHVLTATTLMDAADFHSAPRLSAGIQAMTEQYDLVVLDTSPLSRRNRHNTPPELVAGAVDGVMLMVLTGSCTENQLLESHDRLSQSGSQVLGIVMNDQFAPGLLAELQRECRRFERVLPGLSRRMCRWLAGLRLLRQSL